MKSTLNVALLQKVKKHILEEPNRLVMGTWFERNRPGTEVCDYEGRVETPKCGTVGCIAGWCCLLTDGMEFKGDAETRAHELLGVSDTHDLFYTDSWADQDAMEDFENSTDPKERAQIVAEVIDDFIAIHETGDQTLA
jgi:hypothetical protein